MIKYLKYICLILCFVLVGVLLYEKSRIKKLDYEEFYNKTMYDIEKTPAAFLSSYVHGIKDQFYEDVKSLDDLLEHSEYAALVRIDEKEVYGDGIINHATVLKNIKGLEGKDKIQFYDLAIETRPNIAVQYIGGTTPLKKDNEYFVFLNSLKHQNRRGAMIFSSIGYGYFKNASDTPILRDYNPRDGVPYSLDTIKNYDFVTLIEDDNCHFEDAVILVCLPPRDFTDYINIKKEILEKYNS